MFRASWVPYALVILLGGLLRAWDLPRPVDRPSWREEDVATIARNYFREDGRLLYPRVDWRGDGPGFAEMEFPALPWAMAASYRVVGEHELAGRLMSFALSLVTFLAGILLVRRLLPEPGALGGALFLALNPAWIRTAVSLQPEGLMLAAYIVAAYAFLRWLETDAWSDYALAVLATAVAVLAKLPAAHLGLVFACWLLARHGVAALRRARVWLFAIPALTPAALWYVHAHTFWTTYGNSLGLSNQSHWLGWDLLSHPQKLLSLAKVEILAVWMPAGVLTAAAGAWFGARSRAFGVGCLWLAGCFAYYLIAIRTLSSDWAAYYHVVSVAPVALLVGLAVQAVWNGARSSWMRAAIGLSLALTFGHEALAAGRWLAEPFGESTALYSCAQTLKPALVRPGLIVASGAPCREEGSALTYAYNAPYFFYWLDRKGFNVCIEEQSVDRLEALRQRGAQYFVAEKGAVRQKPGFEADLRARFRLVAECPEALLFDLASRLP